MIKSMENEYFGKPIVLQEITIPIEWNSESAIDINRIKLQNLKQIDYYNPEITSLNFNKTTDKLISGKTYIVTIVPIIKTVTSEDCLSYLEKQKFLLVGTQGLVAIDSTILPKGKYYVSFDKKDLLPKNSDNFHILPYVDTNSEEKFNYFINFFEIAWDTKYCLICFLEK
jgi:hypothetical protein